MLPHSWLQADSTSNFNTQIGMTMTGKHFRKTLLLQPNEADVLEGAGIELFTNFYDGLLSFEIRPGIGYED
jgi:hypothetical protein